MAVTLTVIAVIEATVVAGLAAILEVGFAIVVIIFVDLSVDITDVDAVTAVTVGAVFSVLFATVTLGLSFVDTPFVSIIWDF